MNRFWPAALHPTPAVGLVDTSLRYTDILFGFVIKELFIRLQHWSTISWENQWQLFAGAVLVLGSWIGFRRSLNRSSYEVKFFNLPLFRFVADQLMLILYMRIATLTEEKQTGPPADLLSNTLLLVYWVFALYLVWDLLGCWMALGRMPQDDALPARPRYPEVEDKKMTDRPTKPDLGGLMISLFGLCGLCLLYRFGGMLGTALAYVGLVLVLLGYRFLKEHRKLIPLGNL